MLAQIFVAHVHSAHIRRVAVDDHDLAMIAKIDLEPVAQSLRRAKRQNHDARFGQLAAIRSRQIVTADLIVQHVHAHAFARLALQQLP